MIAHIFGIVAEKFNNTLIIDVQGVGYEVSVTTIDYDSIKLDDEVKFYTYHHIREQSQELFGFSSLASKKLFELLITVQGVGPKAALAILSLGDAETVRNAIANSDSSFIQKASGVGKKTAEGIVVKLQDKVGMPIVYDKNSKNNMQQIETPANDEALEALIALGFTLNDAIKALENIPTEITTSERVRLALKG